MNTLQENLYTKCPLRFSTDGKYRILCVSDVHGGKGYDKDYTVDGLQRLLDKTHPDLVLILGDIAGPGIIHIETTGQLKEMLEGLVAPIESAGIPWAHVYGNHDNNFGVDNHDAQKIYEAFPHCVSKAGPIELRGCGNYVLPIYDADGKKILFNVFGLDSHGGDDKKLEPGVARRYLRTNFVEPDDEGLDFAQVRWYDRTSHELEEYNGQKIPALMVMHVPLFEIGMINANREWCRFEGQSLETPSTQSLNCGMVRAAVENGDVRAFCFGHDHENNFSGVVYDNIIMAFDGYLSAHACHNPDFFGGRVFDVDASAPETITTKFIKAE